MKLNRRYLIVTLLFTLVLTFCVSNLAFAKNNIETGVLEYSEEYQEWLNLPEEERNSTIAPRMYGNIDKVTKTNRATKLYKSSFVSSYNLKDIIPENTVVRDQMQTNTCWAFSTIGALETNLALQDYKAGNSAKWYNFSERHMEYTCSKLFLNNEINPIGFDRQLNVGGNARMAVAYFTNGSGPIDEESMPFENNANTIALSEIQNKTVTAKIIDTVEVPSLPEDAAPEYKQAVTEIVKDHILNYGGVTVSIYGAQPFSEYYNQTTGAIYCDIRQANHSVLIIGWDDNYPVTNFNMAHRPSNPGAWIIKNSWGTSLGNNGLMYLSYEDANVYLDLAGIVKSSTDIDYNNLYQYNELGYNAMGWIGLNNVGDSAYLANVFQKKTSGGEALKEVSISVPQTYECKVYVNPNGPERLPEYLTEVELKEGESETLLPGFHTIEFAKPIEIKGDEFAVVVEFKITSGEKIAYYCLESADGGDIYSTAVAEPYRCYVSCNGYFQDGAWSELYSALNADSTIKAYTDNFTLGDINNDGKINQKDAKLALQSYVGKKDLTGTQMLAGDVTKDDKVNQKDAKQILKYYVGKITEF